MTATPGTRSAGDALRSHAGLAIALARKSFRLRYARTSLGAAWAMAQPLLTAVAYGVLFGRFLKLGRGVEDYQVFVLVGLVAWTFFASGVLSATSSISDNSSLVKKVPIPRVVYPLAAIGGSFLGFLCALSVATTMALIAHGVGVRLLLLPVAVLVHVVVVVAVGVLLAAWHPSRRDVRPLAESSLQLALYGSGVIIPLTNVPPDLVDVLRLNPMLGVVSFYRTALRGDPLDGRGLAIGLAVAAVVVVLGLWSFHRNSPDFADLV